MPWRYPLGGAGKRPVYSHPMELAACCPPRIAVYAGARIAIVAALALTGNIPSSDEARDFVDDIGALGPLLYVPLFVLVNFAVAWPILAGAAGLLFGTAVGTPLALAGSDSGRAHPDGHRT